MKTNLFTTLAFSAMLTLASLTSKAQIDQQQGSFDAALNEFPSDALAQSFTAGVTGNLYNVAFNLHSAVTTTLNCKVFAGNGVGGTLLAYTTYTTTGSTGYNPVPVQLAVNVVSGNVYTFELSSFGAQTVIRIQDNNPYAGGQLFINNIPTNSDLMFQTYVAPAAPTPTATTSVPCGLAIYNMNTSASAVNVSGAVQYRFNFYDNVTNALIATKTQASRTFTFSSVSGLNYGNTYKWTVAVDKGTGFGPESNNSCTVILKAPITNLPCGNSFTNLNITQAAQAVAGAKGYRFSFYDNVTNALVATKTQASNTINFSTVSGLNYGKTYKWRVEVQYNNGSTLLYGPASTNTLCTITFNAPQTTLPCGNTYASTSASIGFPAVSVANSYRVSFYNATTNALVTTKILGTNYVYFNQVSGLAYNTTYKWTVEVNYNNGTSNVYGAPSSTNCLVTWGNPVAIVMNDADHTNARLLSDKSEAEMEASAINLYPNPNNGSFNIELSSVSQVIVTNALGQIVLNKTIDAGKNSLDIQNQSNGLYFVKVIQNNKQQTLKLIKE